MLEETQSNYRWYLLALMTATGTFVATIGVSCMPVFFKEISEELNLSLVQIGTVWGMANLAGIFVSIIGGVISDKFRTRWVLTILCILVGITGSLRGFAGGFVTLSITMFLNGIVRLIVPVALTKTVGIWFRGPRLGLAMGISAMGMGLGLMLGPLISASVISPWLGGWRNVMHFYAGLSVIIGLLWLLFGREHPQERGIGSSVPLRQGFSRLIRLRPLWLLGLMFLFRISGIMGLTGYLPLFLSGRGWAETAADSSLSVFYATSTIMVIPLSFLSDKLGSRKAILYASVIVSIMALSLLPVVSVPLVWVMVIMMGMFMDGFMAVMTTTLLEMEEIGPTYSGIALGMLFTIAHVGTSGSPPLGNSLAFLGDGVPFYFWASLSFVALIILLFVKETGRRRHRTAPGTA